MAQAAKSRVRRMQKSGKSPTMLQPLPISVSTIIKIVRAPDWSPPYRSWNRSTSRS